MTPQEQLIQAKATELENLLIANGYRDEPDDDVVIYASFLTAFAVQIEMTTREEDAKWVDGYPPKPWAEEWFIAITIYGDRVVLRSLPEEYTYDFKTADETYIKRENIKCWMQFPDSNYVPFASLYIKPKTTA